ncbi:TPA: hypothetical protein N0F65_011367 [Lagenidium giganteum]|uniref:Uncharacterized protein n=1 Tax=Lagenidium giganteum TaxID=4803 RepID=A0AAV2Z5G1_9STRA|nr:TPA: hypothetical protein N0F65_011367 [Lagenidium giganteum]
MTYKFQGKLRFDAAILSHDQVQEYNKAIHDSGAPLKQCFGFVDETKHFIAHPASVVIANNDDSDGETINVQSACYSLHTKCYCLQWQAQVLPNGLCCSLYGPVKGRLYDTTMLTMSGLLNGMVTTPRLTK